MIRILLVEDNEMNRDMLSRRLTRCGYSVQVATDGAKGIAMALQTRPDLILMDMSLPEIDGWEAVRRLKAEGQTSGTPIIALTAHAMKGDQERCLAAGMDGYLAKPIRAPELDAILATCVMRRISATTPPEITVLTK